MKKNPLAIRLTLLIISTMFMESCGLGMNSVKLSPTSLSEESNLPTPALTFPELVKNISSDNMSIRLVSIYALEDYGDLAETVVPQLITSLYVDDFDVRRASAYILGKLGYKAKSAVPALIYVLEYDDSLQAREMAAIALGKIGDRSAVPSLATTLSEEESTMDKYVILINCAKSIAYITGEGFTELDSLGYTLNQDGVPLIIMDARIWWENDGQFQNWDGN